MRAPVSGWRPETTTRRRASAKGSGSSRSASMALKVAVFPAIASARIRTAVAENPCAVRSDRAAYLKSPKANLVQSLFEYYAEVTCEVHRTSKRERARNVQPVVSVGQGS